MTDKPEIISFGMTMNDLRWAASNHSDEDREWLRKNHGRVQFDARLDPIQKFLAGPTFH